MDASSPAALSRTLVEERDRAFLFRDLATLRSDIPLFDSVEALRWTGPTPAFAPLASRLDRAKVIPRVREGRIAHPIAESR